MPELPDWSNSVDHMWNEHRITPEEANEAYLDPNAVTFDPDPKSLSGRGVLTIGYSDRAGAVLCIRTVREDGVLYGTNGWKAKPRDRREYVRANQDWEGAGQ